MKRKIKKIKFIDSCIADDQRDKICEPTVILAVGFLIKETDKYITLAREIYLDDNQYQYRGQISIPKVAILNYGKRR